MDIDARLDTGMTGREAIRRAEAWWTETGRQALPKAFNEEQLPAKVTPGGAGPAIVIPGEVVPVVLEAGILSGRRWDKLRPREQLAITKYWHHYHVRVPIESQANRITKKVKPS